jgi:hypothetical protein
MWKSFSSKILQKSKTRRVFAFLVGGSSLAYLAPKLYSNNFGPRSLQAKEETKVRQFKKEFLI